MPPQKTNSAPFSGGKAGPKKGPKNTSAGGAPRWSHLCGWAITTRTYLGVRRAAAPAPTMAPLRTRLLAALLVLALVAGAAGGDPRRGSLLSFYKPVPANTLGMPGGDAPTAPVAPGAVTPPAGEALRAYSACAARGGAPHGHRAL